jgi:hypothetical protein
MAPAVRNVIVTLLPGIPEKTARRLKMAESDILDNVLDPVGQPSGIFGRITDPASENTGVVHNPLRQPTQKLSSMEGQLMAPRLDTLEGKVVYLVETGFHGAKEFMEQASGWFARNMPGVKIESRSTQGSIFTDDPVLWAEIEQKGDAAIVGVGG